MKTTGTTTSVSDASECQDCVALHREVTHWKKNHDNRVAAARFLIERTDLPVERVHAYAKQMDLVHKLSQFRSEIDNLDPSELKERFNYLFSEYL